MKWYFIITSIVLAGLSFGIFLEYGDNGWFYLVSFIAVLNIVVSFLYKTMIDIYDELDKHE